MVPCLWERIIEVVRESCNMERKNSASGMNTTQDRGPAAFGRFRVDDATWLSTHRGNTCISSTKD